jgi:hypothetical protein
MKKEEKEQKRREESSKINNIFYIGNCWNKQGFNPVFIFVVRQFVMHPSNS